MCNNTELDDKELRVTVPPEILDDPDPAGSSVRRLGRALIAASWRIEQEMSGKRGFNNEHERRTAHMVVSQLSDLLPLLEKYPAPPDPNIRYIPPCPECGAKAGKHWAHECPRLTDYGLARTYDYRKKEVIFYEQIKPFAERLKPHPDDVFTCVVCRSRWQGKSRNELVVSGDTHGEEIAEAQFQLLEEITKRRPR